MLLLKLILLMLKDQMTRSRLQQVTPRALVLRFNYRLSDTNLVLKSQGNIKHHPVGFNSSKSTATTATCTLVDTLRLHTVLQIRCIANVITPSPPSP